VSSFEPVAYEAPQRDAVRGLMEEVWGVAASAEDFDWWHERNPTGRRLISLVLDDGRVAGASAMSFLPMRLNGESRDVAFALDAATHPDYRGKGLWSVLELHNEKESAAAGAPAVLGFTNPVAGPILVGKLGWADLASLRLWARPMQLRARDAGFRDGGGETLDRLGADAEDLYERAAARWGNHVVRSLGYLNWRYVDSPRPYRILAARDGGRLAGWAVVTHKVFQGRAVGVVADLVAPDAGVARGLLRRAARAVRGQALVALVSPAERGRYLAAGFLPTHKSIRFIGKPLAGGVRLPTDRAAWHFALGDTDIF
jgi:hypothetical protein